MDTGLTVAVPKYAREKKSQQISTHLSRQFYFWLDASEIGDSLTADKEFIILDQLHASLVLELRLVVKEHRPRALKEAAQLVDDWSSARSAYPTQRWSGNMKTLASSTRCQPPGGTTSKPNRKPSSPGRRCFNCGQPCHHRSRCPKNPRAFKKADSTQTVNKVGVCLCDRSTLHYTVAETINESWTSTIARDTCCSCVLVSEEALPEADVSNVHKVRVIDYLGREDSFPSLSAIFSVLIMTDGWTRLGLLLSLAQSS